MRGQWLVARSDGVAFELKKMPLASPLGSLQDFLGEVPPALMLAPLQQQMTPPPPKGTIDEAVEALEALEAALEATLEAEVDGFVYVAAEEFFQVQELPLEDYDLELVCCQ
jgi:hypothetical protein